MPPRSWDRGNWPRIAILGVAVALLLAPACSTSPSPSEDRPEVRRDRLLFPLEEGRRWVFAHRGKAARVAMRAEADAAKRSARLRIEGAEDRTYARLRWRGTDLLMGAPGGSEATLLRLPARPGTTWAAAPGVRAVVRPDERVTVPAGTFDCLVVRLSAADGSAETYWIAQGVGFVRVDRGRGGAKEEAVLAEWSAGPESVKRR